VLIFGVMGEQSLISSSHSELTCCSCAAPAWGNLGNVLKNQGKMGEAEQAYRNALYYRRNMADMLYNL